MDAIYIKNCPKCGARGYMHGCGSVSYFGENIKFVRDALYGCSSIACDLFSLRVTLEQWNNRNMFKASGNVEFEELFKIDNEGTLFFRGEKVEMYEESKQMFVDYVRDCNETLDS